MPERLYASVPASSANLGPGFDSIGLALELRISADVRVLEPGATPRWTFSGAHFPTHDGLRDEIARGIARIVGARVLPPLEIAVHNDIPLGKGLGGSAAGAVLGVAIGAALRGSQASETELAHTIAEIEGHPDNGIPALLGGVVVAAQGPNEPPTYLRFPPPPGVRAVVVVPEIEMPTVQARAILPATYSRRDTVFNIQRAALVAAAFACGRTDLLRTAMRDRIHQPYRASFVPGLDAMLAYEAPGILGTALSGAGPSVIALVEAGAGPRVAEVFVDLFAQHGVKAQAYDLALAERGLIVEPGVPVR
ncbi:MAG: homoserine kinase [Candidatus Velthaea sp.]